MRKEKIRKNSEVLNLLGLFLISSVLHFTQLSEPRSIVFDEVYYGRYLNSYGYTGEYVFDVHPPHSKMLISFVAKWLGYQGGVDFKQIGQSLEGANVFAMRFLPAFIGTFLPLMFYLFLRLLGAWQSTATIGAIAMALDGGFLIQTRTIAQDGILIFWILSAITVVLATKQKYQLWGALVAGLLSGMAVGTKLTGLVGPFMCGVLLLRAGIKSKEYRRLLQQLTVFAAAAACVYVFGWWLHFHFLPGPGPGDAFMLRTGKFWTDFPKLQQVMHEANVRISAVHSYASHWYGWPLMHKPIFYWVRDSHLIYFIGNPTVWYGALGLFILAVFAFLWNSKKWMPIIGIPILGYFVSYAPYAPVARPLFFYHSMTPLLFSLTTGLLWFQNKPMGRRVLESRGMFAVLVTLILVGYLSISALIYGYDLPYHWQMKWFEVFPSWR